MNGPYGKQFPVLTVSFVYEKHKNNTRDRKCFSLSLSVPVYYLFLPLYILKKNQGIEYNDIKTLRNQNVRCTLCIL